MTQTMTKTAGLKSVVTALYIRCSSQGQSFDAQQEDLVNFASRKGWTDTKIYAEKVSGVATTREQFNKMIDDIKQGLIARVIVWDLSRLSRKGVADVIETINFLQSNNVELISKKEGVSFEGQMGLVMASLFSALGNIDYEMRREKCKLGVEKAREKNGGILPWVGKGGRKKDTSKRSAIIKLLESGATYKEIQKTIGVSPTTISRAFKAMKTS
jgi:DNA invertase Pin-like site-specific DNA recombinase